MPLPLILGIAAAIAGIAGVGSGIHGGVKMKEANDTMQSADTRHKRNLARFEEQSKITNEDMDKLGKTELNILESFKKFADIFEKIQNRPQFKTYTQNGVDIPGYSGNKLKEVSVGAGILLGGVGGAAAGTAGGFAAAGAATAAVMALGTASTGTAIASLSGAAAVNATLAAIGGGTLAAGAGGMALGTAILGAATLGVGLLVGGIIFNITGSSLSSKADEAWSQMIKAEKEIDKVCSYMKNLSDYAIKYHHSISVVNKAYQMHLNEMSFFVITYNKTDWTKFTNTEKLITENTSLLVGLLYNMCKIQFVLKSNDENEPNKINSEVIEKSISDAERFLDDKRIAAIL